MEINLAWQNHIVAGNDLLERDEADAAIETFKKAVPLCANQAQYGGLCFCLGTAYLFKGDKSRAFDCYKQAADHGDADALEELGKYGIAYTPQKPSFVPPGGSSPSQVPPVGAAPSSSAPSALPKDFTGYGNYKWGEKIYECDWVDGLPHGKGKMTLPLSTGDEIYEGGFSGGEMHGAGKYTYPNGDVFAGSFVRDKGKGTMTYANGKTASGKINEYGEFKKSLFG